MVWEMIVVFGQIHLSSQLPRMARAKLMALKINMFMAAIQQMPLFGKLSQPALNRIQILWVVLQTYCGAYRAEMMEKIAPNVLNIKNQ